MGDFWFEYEASPFAIGRDFLELMESGQYEGFPVLLCKWHRYRLLYDGNQLNDDDILDYVVAADNPTVSVLVTQEPPPEPCECPRCKRSSQRSQAEEAMRHKEEAEYESDESGV